MKKYLPLLKYEIKNLLKDKMNLFFIFYPFLMLFIIGFIIPRIAQSGSSEAYGYLMLIMFLFSAAVGCFSGGALLGFSLLENKDEKTFETVSVTPVSLKGYVTFKAAYCTALSFINNIIMVYGLKLTAYDSFVINMPFYGNISLFDNISNLQIIVFCAVNSLITPVIALAMAAVAKNKVEGFVFVKGGGLFIMLPLLMVLKTFDGGLQYVLGLFPNFWPVKGLFNAAVLSSNPANMPFYMYMAVGTALSVAAFAVFFRIFCKKIQY